MSQTSRWNLPNIMTLARLVAIPVLIVTFYLPYRWAGLMAAIIFVGAGITDMLDGWLARRLNQTSRFGAFLDPVADKLIVTAALIMLVHEHNNLWLTLPAIVIISREITVSALREWMAEVGQRSRVAVGGLGKMKTIMQIVAITALLLRSPAFTGGGDVIMTPFLWLAYTLFYIATGLTLWSMFFYLRAAWPELWPPRR